MGTVSLGSTTTDQSLTVDCIVAEKVYDSCTQTVTFTQTLRCDDTCTVTGCGVDLSDSTCTVGAIASSSTTNYSDVTFIVGIHYSVTCANGDTLTETAYTTQVVTLYNPDGTTPSCDILSAVCNCVNMPNGTINCTLTVCLLFQVTAVVQLLIPTYGFCTPAACPAVGPVLPCPPSPLYPPQLGS